MLVARPKTDDLPDMQEVEIMVDFSRLFNNAGILAYVSYPLGVYKNDFSGSQDPVYAYI
jgi:hypothetical protein